MFLIFLCHFETKKCYICININAATKIFFFFFNLYFHVVLPLNSRQATKSDCDANYGIVHCFKHCDVDSQLEDLKL